MPKPWVKWAYQPARAQDIPAAFMRAYAAAIQPPAGPVFLSLPLDDWAAPALGPGVVRNASIRTGPDPARLRRLADAIAGAERPVLIFGAAVARASGWDQAVALAEKMDAPVWAAPASERAPFPEDHPLNQGGLPFAIGPLARHLDGHDLAVVAGAPVFRYYPYIPGDYLPDGLRLWQVTDDPAEAARAPVGDSILGDPVLTIEQLLPLIPHGARSQPLKPPLPHRMSPLPQTSAASDDGRPAHCARGVRRAAPIRPAHAVLVEETPSNSEISTRPGRSRSRTRSTPWLAAGWAGAPRPAWVSPWPSATAAGTGRSSWWPATGPSSTRCNRSGQQHNSGSRFCSSCSATASTRSSRHPPKSRTHRASPASTSPESTFVSLARGYGCHAARADTLDVLRAEAAAAAKRNAPTVLEVPIDATVPPLL